MIRHPLGGPGLNIIVQHTSTVNDVNKSSIFYANSALTNKFSMFCAKSQSALHGNDLGPVEDGS